MAPKAFARSSRSRYPELNDRAFVTKAYVRARGSLRGVAASIGCSRHAVSDALVRHGIAPHGPNRPAELEDRKWLVRRYIRQGRSAKAIGLELGCSPSVVLAALHRHDIPVRPKRPPRAERLDDPEFLREMYWEKGLSIADIAALIGSSPGAVRSAFHRHGIEVRTSGRPPIPQLYSKSWLRWHRARRSPAEMATLLGVSEATMRSALWRSGIKPGEGSPARPKQLDDRQWLVKQYVERERSMGSIARELGCATATVSAALDRLDIPVRHRG